MKKSLLILVVIVGFIACKRDEERKEPTIVGVWKEVQTITYNGKDNSIISEKFPTECEKKGSTELTQDGKIIIRSFDIDNSGNCVEDDSINGTYTYNASTKMITIKVGNEVREKKIRFLAANELHGEEEEEDVNNDGVIDRVVYFMVRQK